MAQRLWLVNRGELVLVGSAPAIPSLMIFQRVTPVFSGKNLRGLARRMMLDPGFFFFFLCGEEDSFHA
jgi:hypothetical protein